MAAATLPYDPHATVDRGVELARRMFARLDPAGDDALGSVRARVHDGAASWFNRLTRRVSVGVGGAAARGPDGRLETIATTIHEVAHKWVDSRAGFGGLLYAGGPGRVSEGLSQVLAGAAMVLEGSPEEQAWGWRVLDPRGATAPFASMLGRPTRHVPLSVTMDDVRAAGFTLVDLGMVHVHSGVVQAAHLDVARALGMEQMARITTDAARTGLHQLTGMRGWASATLASAGRLHGAGSAQQQAVARAWAAAKVLLPG